MTAPTDDARKRADRHGRLLYRCGVCGREFWSRRSLGSVAGPRVSVCGALLNPPVAHCLLTDDLGRWWWPDDEPLPDLLEIDRKRHELEAGRAE